MRRGARRRLGAVKRGDSVICDRCPHAARRAESPRASQRSCVRHTCPVLSSLWRPIDHVRAQRGITSSAAHGCFKDKDSCAKREYEPSERGKRQFRAHARCCCSGGRASSPTLELQPTSVVLCSLLGWSCRVSFRTGRLRGTQVGRAVPPPNQRAGSCDDGDRGGGVMGGDYAGGGGESSGRDGGEGCSSR